MTIHDKTVLITGANRGIGQALVTEALDRGARRVYATTRQPLDNQHPRVTNLIIDVTDPTQVRAAAEQVDALDLLINNAGYAGYDDLSDRGVIDQHLAINLFGTRAMIDAFTPALACSRGAIVNILSVTALAPMPLIASYSISKAAAFSLTLSLRAILARQGISVHAALLGPVDTEMSRDLDIPKAAPESVAHAVFDGFDNDEEEIFPDSDSAAMAGSWRTGAVKDLERRSAALLTGEPVSADV